MKNSLMARRKKLIAWPLHLAGPETNSVLGRWPLALLLSKSHAEPAAAQSQPP